MDVRQDVSMDVKHNFVLCYIWFEGLCNGSSMDVKQNGSQCSPHRLILNTIMAAPPSMLRRLAEALLFIILEVCGAGWSRSARLAYMIGLLAHLVEEVKDFAARRDEDVVFGLTSSGAPAASCLADLLLALQAARRVLVIRRSTVSENADTDSVNKNTALQCRYVKWQLERLSEVCHTGTLKEVELVRAQLMNWFVHN